MKIITNIQSDIFAGITQYLLEFLEYNKQKNKFHLFGIDLIHPFETKRNPPRVASENFTLIKKIFSYPNPHIVAKISKGNLETFSKCYANTVAVYTKTINDIKPDIILINGDHFLSWCLFQAAKQYGKARMCIHYHGILKKEIEHWPEEEITSVLAMERDFDCEGIKYIFPSKLAKYIVEKEIFHHPILAYQNIVIPNPVPKKFFEAFSRTKRKIMRNIGIVGRWWKIKNSMNFISALSQRNVCYENPFKITLITNKNFDEVKLKYGDLNTVRIKKPIVQEELPKFYTAQGVIINPASFETYSNVAQEAVATGTPALINRNMGVAETFKQIGLDNLIIDFNNPDEVLRHVESCIKNPISLEQIEKLKEKCSSGNIFPNYLSFITSKF